VEIARLLDIKVLEEINSSEWASPTFAIPKENGTIRAITDYRYSTNCWKIECHPFPMTKIEGMSQPIEGFTLPTALNLNMVYSQIKLDADSQSLISTIVFFFFSSLNDVRKIFKFVA
jgi:hypothetical protein